MATLILLSQPPTLVSANNAIEYKVKALPGNNIDTVSLYFYSYALGTTIASWSQKPDLGTTDTFTFRVEQIVQDHLSHDLIAPTSHGTFTAPKSVYQFSMFFLPATTVNGVPQNVGSPLFLTACYAFNSCFQSHEPVNFAPFVQSGAPGIRFLTNGPLEKDILPGESEMLSIITDGASNGQYNYTIRGYDASGNLQVMPVGNLSALNNQKRMDIAIGTSNLSQASPTFLNDKVRYELVVNHFTNNLFTFGNNGAFNQNYTGITSGAGVGLSISANRKRSGAGSLKMDLYNNTSPDPNYIPLAWKSGNLQGVYPNSTYVVQAYIYVEDIDITAWALKLQVEGFTDATVTTSGVEGVAFVKAFNNANRANYFDKWHELSLTIVTGNDVQGAIKMGFSGTMLGVNAFVDDVSVVGIVNSSKAIYHIKPQCSQYATRVHFMNRLGAMDSFTFLGTEKRFVKTDSTTYEKLRTSAYNPTARGRQVLQKEGRVRLSCSSDALRPDEMIWLEELLTSPAVYVQRGNINVPVVLRDGEFEVLDPVKNIHRLRVELEYANDMVLQRG